MDVFEDVPNDIFTSVFEFLEMKELIHCVSLVNKQWRGATMQPSVWRTRELKLSAVIPKPAIQLFKQCDITKFILCNQKEIHQVVSQFSNVVTELTLEYSVTVDSIEIVPPFPALKKFHYHSEKSNEMLTWIRQMPNLTLLRTSSGPMDNDIFQSILSLKQLKKLKLFYIISEEQTIELFKELPLLESVELKFHDNNMKSSMWNTVFQINGVSDRLKYLTISQNSYKDSDDTLYNLRINGLESLQIRGGVRTHMILLHSSQRILQRLTIKVNGVDLSQIKLPNLKYLFMSSASFSDILSILTSCNDTLEYLELDYLLSGDYTPVKLTLPRIQTLVLDADEPDFYSDLIANIDGRSMKKLTIICEVTDSLMDAFQSIAPTMTNLRSVTIPHALFTFILHVSFLNTLNLTTLMADQDELTFNTFNILVTGTRLTSIAVGSNETTAENWLLRLVNNCQRLENLYINIFNNSLVDFSEMKLHQNLSSVGIEEYSSIQENLKILLKNSPNLKYIGIGNIPLDKYSSILESIDEYPVARIELSIRPTEGYSTPFNQCHYLNNDKVRNVSCGIQQFTGAVITFEQYLLAVFCTANECKKFTTLLNSIANKEGFLGDDYNENVTIDLIGEIQNRLMKKVVPMITGISHEKRNTLLQYATTENNQLMKDIQFRVLEVLSEVWEFTH
jgi:hypothetical protein